MIYFYANGTCRLPLQSYLRICQKINQTPECLPTVVISNTLKNITLPAMNENLAELLGIITGDGYLGKDKYELCIALDKNADRDYVPHVVAIIQKLFCTQATVSFQKNVARVKVYSKELFTYLNQTHKTPIGNKRNIHRIPLHVWSNSIYLTAFLRGLFDTDGSFHRHRPTDAAVEITSLDNQFLQQVVDALNFLGIRATRSSKNAYVYSKEHIHQFFYKIGSSNPKNQKKYNHFCAHGTVPLAHAPEGR